MNKVHSLLTQAKLWLIKIGSSLLTDDAAFNCLNNGLISDLVSQVATLKSYGCDVVIVSSGAIAAGAVKLGIDPKSKNIHNLQAASAVGQTSLMQAYATALAQHKFVAAQILLINDDMQDAQRRLNACATFTSLLRKSVVPIINENDSVSTAELCFGDNDTLAAMTVNMINADLLVILTDQNGLYDKDPRSNKTAKLVKKSAANNLALDAMVTAKSGILGRGGMYTKLKAARMAAQSGAATVIINGNAKDVLLNLQQGSNSGTILYP